MDGKREPRQPPGRLFGGWRRGFHRHRDERHPLAELGTGAIDEWQIQVAIGPPVSISARTPATPRSLASAISPAPEQAISSFTRDREARSINERQSRRNQLPFEPLILTPRARKPPKGRREKRCTQGGIAWAGRMHRGVTCNTARNLWLWETGGSGSHGKELLEWW